MSFDITLLHFIRPIYLVLLPVTALLWLLLKQAAGNAQWERHIPKEMITVLRVDGSGQSKTLHRALILSWLLLVLAAAGPTWTKQAVPTLQNKNSTVVLLDLSPSMLAEDLNPNRLTRAKFKLIDILRQQADGQVALIAYAGDAHTVSPLTDDPRTIEALLPALHPAVMPSAGSNTEAALDLAQQLLNDAGVGTGEILLITDGVAPEAGKLLQKQLKTGNSVSILGVGGLEPSPIPTQGGGFLRRSNGEIVLSSVDDKALSALASKLGGRFATLSADDSDTRFLLSDRFESDTQELSQPDSNTFDAWADMGHWLVLLILPILLLCFRKGLVYVFPLLFLMPIESEAKEGFGWKDLWQTKDQQGARLLNEQQYDDAANTFIRPDWSAIASYKSGDYQQAASQLETLNDPTNLYNKGNALALAGSLEEAISAYDAVLKQQPEHADAAYNKKVLEDLLKQGENQPQEGSEPQEQQNGDSQAENSESEQDDSASSENSKDSQPQSTPSESENQQQSSQNTDRNNAESDNSPEPNDSPEPDNSPEQQEQQTAGQENNQQDQTTEQEAQAQRADNESDNKANAQDDVAEQAIAGEEGADPLKDSSEQWLRTIEDDPSGLLRRKFEYQAWQRQQQGKSEASNNAKQERF